jgi:hypothetical protein
MIQDACRWASRPVGLPLDPATSLGPLLYHHLTPDGLDDVKHIWKWENGFLSFVQAYNIFRKSFVVLTLVASCRWNCDLGKLSTILEMKNLREQLYTQLPRVLSLQIHMFNVCSFYHLFSLITTAINFIRVSPTDSASSSTQQALTFNKELRKELVLAICYRDDADLRHWHVLKAAYCWLSRRDMLTP